MAVLVLPYSRLAAFYALIGDRFSDTIEGDVLLLDPNIEPLTSTSPAARVAFGHPFGPRITAVINTWITNHPAAQVQLLSALPADWRLSL